MIPDIGISNGIMSVILNYFKAMPADIVFDVVYFSEKAQTRKADIEALGGNVYKISAPSPATVGKGEIRRFFKAHAGQWEALHIHAPHFAVFMAPEAKKAGIKKICTHCHSSSFSLTPGNVRRNRVLARLGQPFADRRFACGYAAGAAWYAGKSFSVLPNAIDCRLYRLNPQVRAQMRKTLHVSDKLVVGHIGRTDITQKNHSFLLQIFAELCAENPHAVLLLAGAEPTNELKALCQTLGITDKVVFLGVRTDVHALLQAFDVFVFPSINEGLPVSVLEAQAAGVPVLMSDTITAEVMATADIQTLSLKAPAALWVQKAQAAAGTPKKDTYAQMKAAGWDIAQNAAALANYYKTGVYRPVVQYPVRVLLVFGKMHRGGAETLAMNLYRHIDRTKLQFDFMVHTREHCDYDDEIRALGGRIYSLPQYNVRNHFQYKAGWKNFLDRHPEYKVVHAHMTGPAAVFLPICKKHGCYTIAHSHINMSQKGLRQQVINLYQLPLRNMADYLFACSANSGEWMFGKDVAARSNYAILKNGVDVEAFAYNPAYRSEIRRGFCLDNKFVLINVSRFHIQKNHDLLLEVFSAVHKKAPDSALLLVGDGERRAEIEQKIQELDLQDSVILTGKRADIPKLLSAADVFVMTSFNEGLPVSLVEAQASGLHVVVTDTVSEEIKLTNLVENCSLEDSPAHWADTILKYAAGYARNATSAQLTAAGYNIKDTAQKLQEFYLSKYETQS